MSDTLITFIASFLLWFMLGGIVVLWSFKRKVSSEQFLQILLTCVIAWIIAGILKNILGTDRPFVLNGAKPLTITVPSSNAFPSTHSAVAFGMASSVWIYDKKKGLGFLMLALLVGVGRVASNVHFPVDVIGGVLIGAFSALLVKRFRP